MGRVEAARWLASDHLTLELPPAAKHKRSLTPTMDAQDALCRRGGQAQPAWASARFWGAGDQNGIIGSEVSYMGIDGSFWGLASVSCRLPCGGRGSALVEPPSRVAPVRPMVRVEMREQVHPASWVDFAARRRQQICRANGQLC